MNINGGPESSLFKPGHKSVGGRPKKLLRRVDEVLHAHGLDPVEEILKLLQNESIHVTIRLKTWIELLPYVYARAKEDPTPVDKIRETLAALTNEQLIARLEEDLKTLKSA